MAAILPAALVQTHHLRRVKARPASADQLRVGLFLVDVHIFRVSGSRRSISILPILPAAAILVARTLAYPGELRSMIAHRLLTVGYWIVAFDAVGRYRPVDSRLGDSAESL